MGISRYFALVACFALGACASASDFKAPIGDFASATAEASTALQNLDSAATPQYNAMELADALNNPMLIGSKDGECRQENSKACTVVVKSAQAGGAALPLQVNSLIPNSIAVMTAITDYANGLNALVGADSTAAVQDGLGKAIGAAITVASTIDAPTGKLIGAIQTPLTDTGVWIFQQYQDSVKINALRTATAAADPTIKQAMDLFSDEYLVIQNASVAQAAQDYSAKMASARFSKGNAAAINALLSSASSYDAALKLRSTNVYAQVATAHAKLTAALQNPNVSLTEAIAQIQVLVQQAKNVQAIAAQIEAARKKPAPAKP